MQISTNRTYLGYRLCIEKAGEREIGGHSRRRLILFDVIERYKVRREIAGCWHRDLDEERQKLSGERIRCLLKRV